MKKILSFLLITAMFFSLNAIDAFAEEAEEKKDVNSPICFITVGPCNLGNEGWGMIFVTDESPLSDEEITADDIIVSGYLTGNIKITNIYLNSKTYDEENNDYHYIYNFRYKGTTFGNAYVYVDACAVADEAGNCNWTSQSQGIHIGLFPSGEMDFDEWVGYIFSLISQTVRVPYNFFINLLWILI